MRTAIWLLAGWLLAALLLLDDCFRIRLRVSSRDNGGEGAESRRCVCNVDLGGLVHADLDTLVIALYVTVDELLGPRRGPGRRPKLTDAELVCLAVAQVLLGFGSERRWLRFADQRLGHLFPYLPTPSAYNRRLRRAAPLVCLAIQDIAAHTPSWCDQLRLVDSTRCRVRRRGRPSSALSWPATLAMATARATTATSGAFA